MDDSLKSMTASHVWYFAYGSNMRSSVMLNRGLKPLAAEKVVVPSHVLTFDIFGLPYSEPAMASIATISDSNKKSSSRPPAVHGIAYLLHHADYVSLVVSEGAGVAYSEVELEAIALTSGGTEEHARRRITVHTLIARYPFRPNAAPSLRYLVSSLDLNGGLATVYTDLNLSNRIFLCKVPQNIISRRHIKST